MEEAQRNGLGRDLLPLRGRVALVTGVSRRGGIGYAIACRLAAYGASVFAHHFADHDRKQEWGADDLDTVLDGVREHLAAGAASVTDAHGDLTEPVQSGRREQRPAERDSRDSSREQRDAERRRSEQQRSEQQRAREQQEREQREQQQPD